MGLVMLPALSVLPAATPSDPAAAAATGTPASDSAPADGFAALIAALASGQLVAATAKTPGDTTALPGASPTVKPKDGTKAADAGAELAGSLAVSMLLALPTPANATTATTTTPQAQSASPGAGPATAAVATQTSALTALVTPTAAPASPPPAQQPAATDANATDAATAPVVADQLAAIPDPVDPATPAAHDATPAADAKAQAPATPPPAPPPADAAQAVKPPDTQQSPGAAAPQNVEISVVRSVGNASQSKSAGDNTPDNATPDQKQAAPAPASQATPAIPVPSPTSTNASLAAQAPQHAAAAHAAPEPPVQQVAQAIVDRAEHGGGEVRIRLDPPELGAVTIHVRIDGNRVQVQVQAERNEAMNLLRQNTLDLTSLLGNRGLNLTDVSVGFGGRQAPQDGQSGNDSAAPANNGEFAAILGVDEAPPTERYNRLQSAYNPDGRHLYRV